MLLIGLERDLWVLMAELATDPANAHKLVDGQDPGHGGHGHGPRGPDRSRRARGSPCPPSSSCPARTESRRWLDVARTVARWAERELAVPKWPAKQSQVVPYLNRLSDLLWALARWQEANAGEGSLRSRGA